MKSTILCTMFALYSSALLAQDIRGYHRHSATVDSTDYVVLLTNKFRKSKVGSGDGLTLIDTRTALSRKIQLHDPISIHGVWVNHIGRHRGERYIALTASTGVNRGGKVTWNAPTSLFLCPLEGGAAVQISPEGTSVSDWELQPHSNRIVMTASKDTNANGKLDNDDDLIILLYDLEKGGPVQEVALEAPPK